MNKMRTFDKFLIISIIVINLFIIFDYIFKQTNPSKPTPVKFIEKEIEKEPKATTNNSNKKEIDDYNLRKESCETLFDKQDFPEAASCFNSMFETYKINSAKYNEAAALLNSNNILGAKEAFEYVVLNEKENKELVNKARQGIEYINKKEFEAHEEESMRNEDYGDYLDSFEHLAVWKNPRNIKVYVDYNDPERNVFKSAFILWDELLGDNINFTFINNPNNANITCYHTDTLENHHVGITHANSYHYDDNPNKNYMKKAAIKVLRKDPNTHKKYTDTQTKSITLHEIGHALGLIDGHSPKRYDLMFENTSSYMDKQARPSNRDINTIKRLYGFNK